MTLRRLGSAGTMRRLWIVVCGALATMAIGAAAAQATYFEGAANGPRIQPRSLYLTADGSLYVGQVVWKAWGGAVAQGSGLAEYHGCTPSCAAAKVHRAGVRVRLSRVRACHGKHYYTRVALRRRDGRLLDKRYLTGQDWGPCRS
jgi:hypothetical protein